MSDPVLGMITLWPVSWVPEGWALCNGQSLSIQQNAALYSLIGTRYGGDQTNFNLPDLRNKVPVGTTSPTSVGQTGGTVTIGSTGGGQALPVSASVPVSVNNMQPYLTLNYIIAIQGSYPVRD